MSNIDNQNDTLDSLDETLDDLADLPEVKPWAAGAHLAKVSVRRNPKKPGAYVVEMIHAEVIELSNPNTDPEHLPKAGDKSTIFISTKKKDGTVNEFGQGQLKLVLKPFAQMLETNSISEILEGTKAGVDCIVVVGIRKSKDEQYDDQQDIKKLEIAGM